MLAAVAVMAFLRSPGQGSTRWRSAALVACGGLTAPTLFGAWLWAIGGLQPCLHTFFSVMPLYAKMHDRPFADYAREFWPIWLPCLLSVPAAFAGGKPDTRRVLLILGVAYGALHYLLQGKGWLYQLYPLLGFGSALIAGVLGDLPKLRREAGAAVCGLAAAFTIALGAWDGRLRPALALTADRMATVSALEADLAQRLRPGVRVQTFDTTGGCVHALFRVHASLPTRFLCDYLFYSYTDRPYVREIHSDLIARMAERPPELLVVYRWGWPAGQYERIGKFQALKSVIDAEYQVDVTRPQYVIYSRRARYAQVAPESGR